MTKIAIVGGGISGQAIQRACQARGLEAGLFSRSTGFDVLHDDARTAFPDAEVIIDAAAHFTTSQRVATDFFTLATSRLAAASNALGAHHILLSIVNCDLPQVQGYGYFAGKVAQERVARAESERLTIVRSTQWFDFAGQTLQRMKFGPFAIVPSMRMQPIALDAVAAVIADTAAGEPSQLREVAGPEVMTLWELTKQIPHPGIIPIPLAIPTGYGKAFRQGALVPDDTVPVAGPTLAEWLKTH